MSEVHVEAPVEDSSRLWREVWHYIRHNLKNEPNRWMAQWLRRQGWVAFYLDEQARECRSECWMKLYQESEKHGR